MKFQEPKYGVFFEGQYARRTGQLGLEFEPTRDMEKLRAAGITTICMQVYETYSGTLLYNSKRFPQFRENNRRDYLGETVDAAKSLGMNVWLWSAEKGTPMGGPIYNEFRDCAETDQRGNLLATWDHNFICMCINSRWRDFLCQVYEEVLTSYSGIDCIIVSDEVGYNDAVRWGGYCPRCIERFAAKYGQEPPRSENWEDEGSLWHGFVRERFSWWRDYVSDLAATAKKVAPDVSTAVIINWFALSTVLKGVDPWAITSIPDIDFIGSDLFYRVFEHDHPTYQSWVGSLMQALARQSNKKVFLTSAAYRTVCPSDIMVGTTDVASNTDEMVFYYNLRHLCDRQPNLDAVQGVSETTQRAFAKLPDAVPDEGAAILFPRYLWEQHYYKDSLQLLCELTGMYQCLTLAGIPAKIIFEDELSDLERYYLVVVPGLFSAPEHLAAALESYVRQGGLLLMSLQSSRGPQSTGESALWRLFGAEYAGHTPPIQHLHSNDHILGYPDGEAPLLSLPVYDWPVVQHQLFGGFPTVSHRRANLNLTAGESQVLVFGTDDSGNDYPVMVETRFGQGAAILSCESFGANFDSYMQKCAGHPSIWLTRAMIMRDYLRAIVLKHVQRFMPATVETSGNVAAYFKKGTYGYAVWLVNHEYTERQGVKVTFAGQYKDCSLEVLNGEKVSESRQGDAQTIEVTVDPVSVAIVFAQETT